MNLLIKRILSKWYHLIVILKGIFIFDRKKSPPFLSIEEMQLKYSNYTKIVSIASGPSTSKIKLNPSHLYITTNYGYQLFNDITFLFYVNDGFFLKKLLATHSSFLKPGQEIIFWFEKTILHEPLYRYLKSHIYLLKNYQIYFISSLCEDQISQNNFRKFYDFFKNKKLEVKIQNSGVFLLLFGYYLSKSLGKPFELYGLDLGVGGVVHFNNKGVVGKSVVNERVQKNVSIYLDYIHQNKPDFINHSYFKGSFSK